MGRSRSSVRETSKNEHSSWCGDRVHGGPRARVGMRARAQAAGGTAFRPEGRLPRSREGLVEADGRRLDTGRPRLARVPRLARTDPRSHHGDGHRAALGLRASGRQQVRVHRREPEARPRGRALGRRARGELPGRLREASRGRAVGPVDLGRRAARRSRRAQSPQREARRSADRMPDRDALREGAHDRRLPVRFRRHGSGRRGRRRGRHRARLELQGRVEPDHRGGRLQGLRGGRPGLAHGTGRCKGILRIRLVPIDRGREQGADDVRRRHAMGRSLLHRRRTAREDGRSEEGARAAARLRVRQDEPHRSASSSARRGAARRAPSRASCSAATKKGYARRPEDALHRGLQRQELGGLLDARRHPAAGRAQGRRGREAPRRRVSQRLLRGMHELRRGRVLRSRRSEGRPRARVQALGSRLSPR